MSASGNNWEDTTGNGADDAADLVRGGLAALDDAGVTHCLRNGVLSPHVGGRDDVDVLVAPSDTARAVAVLTGAGWTRWSAPGHHGHVFMLRCNDFGVWVKLDVVDRLRYGGVEEDVLGVLARRALVDGTWSAAPEDVARHRAHRAAGRRERVTGVERVRRALPIAGRRLGPVVALVGPDGAGKGTVLEILRESLPVAVTDVYLGDRRSAGPPRADGADEWVADRIMTSDTATHRAGPVVTARECAFVLRKLARLAPSGSRALVAAMRGHVVLCDRHPLDAAAVRPTRAPWAAAFEQFLVRRIVPRPDLLVVLDAPGAELFARKGEHSPEVLERWRRGYLKLPGARVVSTLDGPEVTAGVVRSLVWQTSRGRRRPAVTVELPVPSGGPM